MAGAAAATWDDVDQASAPPSKSGATWGDVDKISPPATQAPPSVAPEDVPLKDKPIPDQPGPMRMRQEFLRTHGGGNTTKRGINEANKTAAENAGMAIATEGLGEGIGAAARPVARYAAENIIPSIEHIPWVGAGIRAAEEAPTALKAMVRGGSTGAGIGAIEQAIRTHLNPWETAKGALYGGAGGALMGGGAYGIGKLAAPQDFQNIPFAGESEPPVTTPKGIPKIEIPNEPQISVRRGPGEIALEHLDQAPEERISPFASTGTKELPGGGVLQRSIPLLPGKTVSPMTALEQQIQQGAGWKPLEPNISLRAQPRSVGAAAATPPQMPPRAGVIPNIPLGSRVAVPIGEEFGPMAKSEGRIPTLTTEEPARQMGAPPLQPNVSLRAQPKTGGAMSEQATLEQRYPDKAVRQMVHANGPEIVDAIGNDAETMKAVHNLSNPDVRQALINSGEDMGQVSIGNRKVMGESQMTRQEAFKRLLAKGHAPQDIVKLAQRH